LSPTLLEGDVEVTKAKPQKPHEHGRPADLADETVATVTEADEIYLPAARVRRRYNITDMGLYRWVSDEDREFPKPMYIGERRYWRLSELIAFERRAASQPRAAHDHMNPRKNRLAAEKRGGKR
jgi:predicted DNA-binding transcriptional regulator AlpA